MAKQFKYTLPEDKIPENWYNIQADLPKPLPPPLHPGTMKPIGPDDLAPLFPMELLKQEMSQDRWYPIPEEVREVFKTWRPTPLYRAHKWEEALNTKAKIFYKYEGTSPTGSHKPNTAIPQVYYNKLEGTQKIITETGAGQWGCALAWAGQKYGVPIEVYQVKLSYEAKPHRKTLMETYGATCYPSPSTRTKCGAALLEKDPNCPGSLGIAVSEAVEVTATSEGKAKYALGSLLNHVLMHQTIVGLESIEQMKLAGEYPDVVIGCVGGGSNFAGMCFPWVGQKYRKVEGAKPNMRVVAVEPASCPTLTKGKYTYDWADTAQLCPIIKAHTLGHTFVPPVLHAGGLRYHGIAPSISHLQELGDLESIAIGQVECFDAGALFAKSEGILPAPEATHAIAATAQEAKKAKEGDVLLFNMCGHGHFDMTAWQAYNEGKLVDQPYDPNGEQAMALSGVLPQVEGAFHEMGARPSS